MRWWLWTDNLKYMWFLCLCNPLFFSQDPAFQFKNTSETEITLECANSLSHETAAEAWRQGKPWDGEEQALAYLEITPRKSTPASSKKKTKPQHTYPQSDVLLRLQRTVPFLCCDRSCPSIRDALEWIHISQKAWEPLLWSVKAGWQLERGDTAWG